MKVEFYVDFLGSGETRAGNVSVVIYCSVGKFEC